MILSEIFSALLAAWCSLDFASYFLYSERRWIGLFFAALAGTTLFAVSLHIMATAVYGIWELVR